MEQPQIFEIQVRYLGNQPPTVTLPPELAANVRVSLIEACDEGALVLEYKGVSVYRTVMSMRREGNSFSAHWLATKPALSFESPLAFDERRLSQLPPQARLFYEEKFPAEPLRQKLAFAIDRGWLTEHGYVER